MEFFVGSWKTNEYKFYKGFWNCFHSEPSKVKNLFEEIVLINI